MNRKWKMWANIFFFFFFEVVWLKSSYIYYVLELYERMYMQEDTGIVLKNILTKRKTDLQKGDGPIYP